MNNRILAELDELSNKIRDNREAFHRRRFRQQVTKEQVPFSFLF